MINDSLIALISNEIHAELPLGTTNPGDINGLAGRIARAIARACAEPPIDSLIKKLEAKICGNYSEREAYGRGLDSAFTVAIEIIRDHFASEIPYNKDESIRIAGHIYAAFVNLQRRHITSKDEYFPDQFERGMRDFPDAKALWIGIAERAIAAMSTREPVAGDEAKRLKTAIGGLRSIAYGDAQTWPNCSSREVAKQALLDCGGEKHVD